MARIEIGAPSLTGKSANTLVATEFAKAKFPLIVKVTNHMPRPVVFPEVDGLHLQHCACGDEGNIQTVTITNPDLFARLASSFEQVAELNGYELALTIEDAPVAPVKGKAEASA